MAMQRMTGSRIFGGPLAAAFAAVLGTAALTGAARAEDPVPFKVGISSPVVSILPVYLAEAGGFYEKQGLDVEVISAEGGTRGVQVLLSGEIQVMHVGLSVVVAANAAGADVRAIASTTNTLPITIFAREKTDPPLPKGATVGISTIGSETDIALTLALQGLGMTRDDVEITQIGGSSKRYAAMKAGRVDAAPLLEPGITLAKSEGMTPVYDLSAAGTPWIFDAVVVGEDYLKEHPDLVDKFMRAYVEGAYWGLANPDEAKKVIVDKLKSDSDTVTEATYQTFAALMPRDARPSVEGAQNVIAQSQATGLAVSDTDPASYLDFGPIERLEAEGFFKQMQETYHVQ